MPPIVLNNLAATQAVAEALAPVLRKRDVLLLKGDLGAGKTTFARFLLHALGVAGEVPSPTFTLVQAYELQAFPVFHFDLYRLKTEDEMEELGFDEACADGLVIVEWPEKAASAMPRGALSLSFQLKADGVREVIFSATETWAQRLEGIF